MKKLNALLIDDDRQFCDAFTLLSENQFEITLAHTGKIGLKKLSDSVPDVVLLDLRLGDGMDGLQVLKKIKGEYPDMPVIMITEHAEVDTAVEAMKLGALHYTAKSPNIKALKIVIERQLENINWKLLYQEKERQQFDSLIAESAAMMLVLKRIEKISKSDSTVLIQGETGTGKELVAHRIHELSHRNDYPFVAINCSNLPAQLFESEFFGHEKGAFTGAYQRKKGKLELAQGGTVFLDEIVDLPVECQAKILRVLEQNSFARLGGNRTLFVDVRFLVATNKPLQEAVEEKVFREDLFYRLNVIEIDLPPLRDRQEDISLLAEYFLHRVTGLQRKNIKRINSKAMKKLQSYTWPGNVRQLINVIERAVIYANDEVIDVDDIEINKIRAKKDNIYNTYLTLPYKEAIAKLMDDFKRVYLPAAVKRNNDNVTDTAKKLGINRQSLHRMLNEIGVKG